MSPSTWCLYNVTRLSTNCGYPQHMCHYVSWPKDGLYRVVIKALMGGFTPIVRIPMVGWMTIHRQTFQCCSQFIGDRGGPISSRLGAPALIDSGSSLLVGASNCCICRQELVRVQHIKIVGWTLVKWRNLKFTISFLDMFDHSDIYVHNHFVCREVNGQHQWIFWIVVPCCWPPVFFVAHISCLLQSIFWGLWDSWKKDLGLFGCGS